MYMKLDEEKWQTRRKSFLLFDNYKEHVVLLVKCSLHLRLCRYFIMRENQQLSEKEMQNARYAFFYHIFNHKVNF